MRSTSAVNYLIMAIYKTQDFNDFALKIKTSKKVIGIIRDSNNQFAFTLKDSGKLSLEEGTPMSPLFIPNMLIFNKRKMEYHSIKKYSFMFIMKKNNFDVTG